MKQTAQYNRQTGAVLVLSLLVLSFIMFTALSLASVLLVELRSARYLDSAIIAHYAAESGAEKALFKLKEAHSIDELTPGQVSAGNPYNDFFTLPGDASESGRVVPTDSQRSFSFNAISRSSEDFSAYNIPVNQSVQLDIFDPDQETSPSIDTGAQTLNIDWSGFTCRGSDRLEISLLELQNGANGLEIVDTAQNPKRQYPICNCANTTACTAAQIALNRSSFYRIGLRPIDHDMQTVTVTLTNDDNEPPNNQVAIPSQIFIQTGGQYKDATQTVTVQTPWNNGVADLFNYVIFSESSLIKNVISQNVASFQSRCGYCAQNIAIGCSSESDCVGLSPTTCTLNAAAFCYDNHGNPNGETSGSPFNQNIYGQCNAKCSGYTFCGDGVRQSTVTGGVNGDSFDEQCDDGNYSDTDSCNAQCLLTYCGDGIVQGPEDTAGPNGYGLYENCDEGAGNGSVPGHCNATCTGLNAAGNGNVCKKNCNVPINGGG